MNWIEVIGWVGNVVVITQFLQKDMLRLRVLGVIGGSVWLIVAIMMNSLSLTVLNITIIGIQLYHIRKIHMNNVNKERFKAMGTTKIQCSSCGTINSVGLHRLSTGETVKCYMCSTIIMG
jgi:hypothetical protein